MERSLREMNQMYINRKFAKTIPALQKNSGQNSAGLQLTSPVLAATGSRPRSSVRESRRKFFPAAHPKRTRLVHSTGWLPPLDGAAGKSIFGASPHASYCEGAGNGPSEDYD